MLIWTFIHELMMFIAVAFAIGMELIMLRVARSEDVRAVRTVFRLAKPFGRAVPLFSSSA